MEDQDISAHNLRSRSRSKTPLPAAGDTASLKPINSRNTPLHMEADVIHEENEPEVFTSPPAHRTRNAMKSKTPHANNVISPEESGTQKQHSFISSEDIQTSKNYSYGYEEYTTTRTVSANGSRISLDAGKDGSRIHSSLSGSDYSNESFAESVLADSSRLSVEEGIQHLPYRVYKCAVEYWNKYPKTDYTYSRLSKDRVELAPGQIAVPNMSRPSLHSSRLSGLSSLDLNTASSTSSLINESELRQRWLRTTQNSKRIDSISDSEVDEIDNWQQTYSSLKKDNRWWITKLIVSVWTYVVTTTTTVKSKIIPQKSSQRHSYTNNYYTYTTETNNKTKFTTVSETIKKKRFWIPLLLLLLLIPALYYWWFLMPTPTESKEEVLKVFVSDVNNKFEITDDLINQIVLRVKQSMPPIPPPEPVIIEKTVETQNVVDNELLAEQQYLIDKLSADILALKNKDNSIDEALLSAMISNHVSNTIMQILGVQSTDKYEIRSDLFKQNKDYIDDKMLFMKDTMLMDMNNLDERIKREINEIKNEKVLASSFVGGSISSDPNCHCDDMIRKIVKDALLIYDADKTGLVDYALESAGGQVISIRCTQPYQTNSAVFSVFGFSLWYPYNSPRTVLTPGSTPGNCWAFQGFPGYLVVKLFHRIKVTGFTLEHASTLLLPHGQIESAPRKFTVWGLQDEFDKDPYLFGTYEYRNDSTPVQYFGVENALDAHSEYPGHEFVELRIESNHGNPVYTCLYRFRVHGDQIDDVYFKQNQ